MMARVRDPSTSNSSGFLENSYCQLCIDDGKKEEAYGYCTNCEEYLCQVCYNGHTRSRAARNHVLLDKASMEKVTEQFDSNSSDFLEQYYCQLCIDDGTEVEAHGYCTNCEEYLCQDCYNGHTRSRVTKHHVLLDKANMPKNTPLPVDHVSKDVSTMCKNHGAKPVEFYCQVHDAFGCSTCFATVHKGCPKVESILEQSQNFLSSQAYKDFVLKLQSMKSKSTEMLQKAAKNKRLVQKCCSDAIASAEKVKEEIIKILNEFEGNIVNMANMVCSKYEENLDKIVEDCTDMSKRVDEISSELEQHESTKRVCQLYIRMKETKREVEQLNNTLKKAESNNAVRTFTFEPNGELRYFLQSPDVLGNIQFDDQQKKESSLSVCKDPNNLTVRHVTDISVKAKRDTKECSITGSAVLSANRVIITDYENSKVKLLNTNLNKLIGEIKVPSNPWDITVIRSDLAAVTLPNSKKILLLKATDSLTKEREISVRDKYYGVAYANNVLFVTVVVPPRLDMIDLKGNVIRKIEHRGDGSNLFAWPQYVCVSNDWETVYVSDENRGAVTSIAVDGTVKSVYRDTNLKGCGKVCSDHLGNVYICCFGARNVHVISADCQKANVILTETDGLDSGVLSVSHCQDTNRLFLGMQRRDKLKIYQIS